MGVFMIQFIPPYCGEEIKSNAEKKMFDVLQKLQCKNGVVLHSLGLPKHQSKIYGEIDFVVVCDRGVACLEIKGGRVACREGRWFFTDRYGVEREKSEGPFAQVIGNMFSMRNILKEKYSTNPHIKNVLVAAGVVFPDITFTSQAEEIIPEMIFDQSAKDITQYIQGVFDYWEKRQHKAPARLAPGDIREIVTYLRGEFCFVPMLGNRLSEVEDRLVRLTAEQSAIMDGLALNAHLLVEGAAGTGKTLLATDYAKKKAEQGKKVLYLTYNKNLAHNIQNQSTEIPNLKIINIHALFGEYIPIDMQAMTENAQEYFARTLPEEFYDYISRLEEEELEPLQYDVLVLDEGQDILKPDYMYSLDCLLKGGWERGYWAIFYDEKQNLYNPEFTEGMQLLEDYFCTRFRLSTNCRNTIQIGTYGALESGNEIGAFIRENGEEVQKIVYRDEQEEREQLKSILKNLKKEKVDLSDVVFLSPKKYSNSRIKETGIEVYELGKSQNQTEGLPVYATIQGFKGLDAKVVILVDIEDIRKENYSKYIYTAISRARTLLYVVGSQDFWKEHEER